jgi:hypothetical protein
MTEFWDKREERKTESEDKSGVNRKKAAEIITR